LESLLKSYYGHRIMPGSSMLLPHYFILLEGVILTGTRVLPQLLSYYFEASILFIVLYVIFQAFAGFAFYADQQGFACDRGCRQHVVLNSV